MSERRTKRNIYPRLAELLDWDFLYEQFTRESLNNFGAYIQEDSVRFPFDEDYADLSSFVRESCTNVFASAFSFAELQPYLLPKRKLRRRLS